MGDKGEKRRESTQRAQRTVGETKWTGFQRRGQQRGHRLRGASRGRTGEEGPRGGDWLGIIRALWRQKDRGQVF